jgi:hypothetical protein
MKTCPDCGTLKPLEEFPRNARRPDGRGRYCKGCFAERYRAHRERKVAQEGRSIKQPRVAPEGQKWCPACEIFKSLNEFGRNRSCRDGLTSYCKPCHNAKGKETRERLYGGSREYHLGRRYGLTSADVDAMIETQGGTCATCPGKPEHVDHDHETNKVRGILCFNCNQALGNVRDDPDVLHSLIAYLGRYGRPAHNPPEPVVVEMFPSRGPVVFEYDVRHHAA